MKRTIIITLLALSVFLSACTQAPDTTSEEPVVPDVPVAGDPPTSLATSCTDLGGAWLEDFQECEHISKEACESLGGNFNECASACRNDPDAEVCTMQCVLVCEFFETETFVIGPELKDCVGVGPQKCMVVNDKLFYDTIQGFEYEEGYTYEIIVEKTERDNPPADASKYLYTLKQLVSKEPAIPEGCTSWFDGCNNCMVGEDGVLACTRMYCAPEAMEEPKCTVFEQNIPEGCTSWFDGCNTCTVSDGKAMACTEMACNDGYQPPKCLAFGE